MNPFPAKCVRGKAGVGLWLVLPTLLLLRFVYPPLATAQAAPPPASMEVGLKSLIQEASRYQLEDFHHTAWALRYRLHRVDSKEDSVRLLVESSDGNVARTLERHGQPLTSEQDVAERARLQSITAEDLLKRRRGAEQTDKFGVELITALPDAMIFTPVPGDPQLPELARPQLVLDYAPNPAYRPSTKSQSLLAGINGRVWIDKETHHLLRIQVNIFKNLDLVAGILARVYAGGSMLSTLR